MAHADIIIYGLIAVVLLARLWAVFGRRNEEDRQRPNPFATPAPNPRRDDGVIVRPGSSGADDAQMPALPPLLAAPMSLAGALERVKQLDSGFDEKQFLQEARKIFADVVAAFAKGDLSTVQDRLGPSVLPGFQAAVDARVKAGETLDNKITRMHDTEVNAARTDDKCAYITVRFVSEQQNILRDASGIIVSGAPGKTEEIIDLWTFARDAKSGWQLVETKS